MKVQTMRKRLKEVGSVPRSNEDVMVLYKEKFSSTKMTVKNTLKVVNVGDSYTYIGGGESAPSIINFMGIQIFKLGELTKVTDPVVLAKIKGNPTFKKGSVTTEEIYEENQRVAKIAQHQIDENVKLQIFVERENRKAG